MIVQRRSVASFDIAYMHPGTVRTEFSSALIDTAIAYPGTTFLPMSGKNLVRNKNLATQYWLDNKKKDWLLWLDADISWTTEGLSQLLATADDIGPSIMSGLAYQWSGSAIYPSFFMETNSAGDVAINSSTHQTFPRDKPFKILAAGGGMMLIHREVFASIQELPHIPGYPWFYSGTRENGSPEGYAKPISKKARKLGYDVWVEPRFEVTHYEYVGLTDEHYDRWWNK